MSIKTLDYSRSSKQVRGRATRSEMERTGNKSMKAIGGGLANQLMEMVSVVKCKEGRWSKKTQFPWLLLETRFEYYCPFSGLTSTFSGISVGKRT
jgi:hypothetical protein